jgi:Domain of unknown function DUF29/DnaB-like helicase N terminal domain
MPLATRERPQTASPALNEILEAEQTIIGRILRDNAEYRIVAEILRSEDFTERLHWGVFDKVRKCIEAGKAASLADVLPRVASVGLGGALAGPYLERLIAEASPSADLRELARFLARAARERRARPPDGTGYEEDFYLWANEQAERLRRGEWARLDVLTLAEEIEDLGREVYNELESRFRVILLHLLKWDHQPERRTRSWTSSIKIQRLDAEELLEKHHSLEPRVPEAIAEAYRRARIEASGETGLDEEVFPEECPYSFNEIMTRPIPWPQR